MSKSIKQQFNGLVTIKDREYSLWLRGLLFMCFVMKTDREYYFQLMSRIRQLQTHSGNAWIVKYLKESTRLVMVWCSQDIEYRKGIILSSGIPIKISGGLPCIIPTHLRRKMEIGDMKTVKIVLTMLNLYRVIKCPPILKLETITDPFKGISETLPIMEIKKVIADISLPSFKPRVIRLPLNLTTAGPNFKISILSAPFDAFTFSIQSHLLESFKIYADATGNSWFFKNLEEECARVQNWILWNRLSWMPKKKPLMLGKLSKKFEAAGKVRIFAITDWWTQNLFEPLHNWINDTLRIIEQDGTFDQLAPISKLTGSYRVSYDLSAATDRLPVALQVQILGLILGQEAAMAWANLLTKRDWFLNVNDQWVPYRYAVGQPMGAYSSFPMLALTHHVIVQIAARRSGFTSWFTNYAILGDDVVIADPKVGVHYLYIMRDHLGVEINLSKSLESNIGVMEFAKRLIKGVEDLSPISPKVLLLAIRNIFYLPDLVKDMVDKGFGVDTSSLLALVRRPRLFKGIGKVNVYKAVWSCFLPFGVLDLSPIPFNVIGSMGRDLVFKIRDFIYDFQHKAFNSAMESSYRAKDSWSDAREKERGGLPGSVLTDLYSTKVIDSHLGGPLANMHDYSLNLNIFRGVTDEEQIWFYLGLWLKENFAKLIASPAFSVNDIISPIEQSKSRGQLAFDFWSMVHIEVKLPKIKRHSRKSKSKTTTKSSSSEKTGRRSSHK